MNYTQHDLLTRNGHYNLYQRMIEEISDYAIILLDREGYIQNWNKGAEAIKQYSEDEIIGRHFSVFYFQEDVESGLPDRLINEAIGTGLAHYEGWRRRKDGSRFWGSVTITALHDDDGKVFGFSKVTRDLTERKVAEDNLRLSEERYHKMIAEVQDYAIILMDENGFIQNWNAGAEKIKGYRASEIIGKRFEVFYPENDRKSGLPDALLQLAREEGRAIHEGWRLRKDSTRFWGSVTITALHAENGEVIGFSKVTRDLTQKKMAEEQLLAYTSELEMQNNELEQFAYVAAHDLQEPLRKIQTFTGLITENYHDKVFVARYLDKLEKSARRMSELMTSLLSYSKVATYTHDKSAVDLNDVLKDVEYDMELLLSEKRAKLHSEKLPVVNGHYIQFVQLFSNLIGNSLKFCAESPEIRISAKMVEKNALPENDLLPYDRYTELSFHDNGIGFSQEYRELIFSLFQRLHDRTEFEGTGIGLALCRKIVQNHDGFITAEGEEGKGATFRIFLPV